MLHQRKLDEMKLLINTWAKEWINLSSWCRPLEEIWWTIEEHEGGPLGIAYVLDREMKIRYTGDVADTLTTIVHELAHLATPGGDGHSQRWKQKYSDAIKEITSELIPTQNVTLMDLSARDAIRNWWKYSGNEFAWNLLTNKKNKI